jgi:hypothetical protein
MGATWGQCFKITVLNYCGNFNPTFSSVKMILFITIILG